MTAGDHTEDPGTIPGMRFSDLLKVRSVWVTTAVVTSVLIFLMTLIYVGSVVDPQSHLHGLPVLLVNQDSGATVGSKQIDLGGQVIAALTTTPAVSDRLAIRTLTLVEARAQMDQDNGYATILVPPDFSRSVLELRRRSATGGTQALPTIALLTNVRAGSIGVSLAAEVAEPALHQISLGLGKHLQRVTGVRGSTTPSTALLRADPIAVTATPYRPLPPHSALGLSAFYISLITIMCGFLGATLVNASIDAALGYAASEIGPKWHQRAPVRISRWQTLLAKWVMAIVLIPLLTGIMLLVAIGICAWTRPTSVISGSLSRSPPR